MNETPVVIVCGSRDMPITEENYRNVANHLDNIICFQRNWITEKDKYGNFLPKVRIVTGGASGVDSAAIDWAVVSWTDFKEYPVSKEEWKILGKAAGPIRNKQMLDEEKPDLVIAFPGGKGTADMVRQAKKAGVEVIKIE